MAVAGQPVDAAFFRQYDSFGQELVDLTGVENALRNTQNNLAVATKKHKQLTRAIQKNENKQAHHVKKIDRCEHHWFYSTSALQPTLWCSGGVSGRLDRQQGKLKKLRDDLPVFSSQEKKLREEDIPALKKKVSQLTNANEHKEAVSQNRHDMFEGAVAGSPTQLLQALHAAVGSWQSALNLELQIQQGMQVVSSYCRQAQQMFHEAQGLLGSALQTNRGAQFNNAVDGNEFIERMQQEHRNQQVRAAQEAVTHGAQTLQMAFTQIPPQLAQRHPQAAAGLGQVHLPIFNQADVGTYALELFGGDVGDFIAGAQMANRIHRNLGIVQEALGVIAHQIAIVDGLMVAIAVAASQREEGLRQEEGKLATEKVRIFEQLRAQAFGAGAPVARPIPAAPIAQVYTDQAAAAMQTAQGMQLPPVAQPLAQPTAQPYQPTAQPVQPTAQPVQPTAQPFTPQPTAMPVQPTAQAVLAQPVQPTTASVQPTATPRTSRPIVQAQAVPRAATQEFYIDVPAGVRPGDAVQVTSPNTGKLVQVVIPPGVLQGQRMKVIG